MATDFEACLRPIIDFAHTLRGRSSYAREIGKAGLADAYMVAADDLASAIMTARRLNDPAYDEALGAKS